MRRVVNGDATIIEVENITASFICAALMYRDIGHQNRFHKMLCKICIDKCVFYVNCLCIKNINLDFHNDNNSEIL